MKYNAEFKLEFQPPLQEWKERILNMVFTARKALSTIECLKSKEIGTAREMNLMKIFNKDDELISTSDEKLEQILDFFFEIPNLLEKKMQNFFYVHVYTLENYKKKLKKLHFQDFEEEIKKMKFLQSELEQCLFANKLNTGLFLVDVEILKVYKN